MGWYSEVARDVSKIPEAIKYFDNELVQARVEVKLKGNVEKHIGRGGITNLTCDTSLSKRLLFWRSEHQWPSVAQSININLKE